MANLKSHANESTSVVTVLHYAVPPAFPVLQQMASSE